jgi:hypothetical protein
MPADRLWGQPNGIGFRRLKEPANPVNEVLGFVLRHKPLLHQKAQETTFPARG